MIWQGDFWVTKIYFIILCDAPDRVIIIILLLLDE